MVINKPHGLLVHRTPLAADVSENALYMLRDQLDQYVYPSHRIDRKTGGCLVFGLTKDAARTIALQFAEGRVHKEYIAIVRGYVGDHHVDYPIVDDTGRSRSAITDFMALQQVEIPLPHGKFPTSRYTVVRAKPLTGRMHQIRRHCNHLRHPIIGDRPHGCNKQNRLWKQTYDFTSMLLHARKIQFSHPKNGAPITIEAPFQHEFIRAFNILNVSSDLYDSF